MNISNRNIVSIMERTLNNVDSRLVNHGLQVACKTYRMYQLLPHHYTHKELSNILILALLHDIGAYKTEEIDRMVEFETHDVWAHSIYGYLFLKHFSPLKDLAPVLLFHHANCAELEGLSPELRQIANIIAATDRIDVYSYMPNATAEDMKAHFIKNKNLKYRPEIVDAIVANSSELLQTDVQVAQHPEFQALLYNTPMHTEEILGFMKMILLSIDFRCPQTVAHSIATAEICRILAELILPSPEEREDVVAAAWLHDLGKAGVPISIIEKAGKLNEKEMGVMRSHIQITESILKGNVKENVLRMAIRHHEKLNGTGYPMQFGEKDLTLSERMIAVADIFSALSGTRVYKKPMPKEQVAEIMTDMASSGHLDGAVVSIALQHFDFILSHVKTKTEPIYMAYDEIGREFADLYQLYHKSEVSEVS